MASRTPRRTFARPFVVTLIAAPACYTQTATPPPEPPPQQQPPAPQQPPPQPPPPHIVANPPRPMPVDTTPADGTRWTVMKNGASCEAIVKVDCPKPVNGVVATCNPPPPHPYECPAGVSLDAPITVVVAGGQCMIEPPAFHCPPKAMCNPPPPHHVTCPK